MLGALTLVVLALPGSVLFGRDAAPPPGAPGRLAAARSYYLESTWHLPDAPAMPVDVALLSDGTLLVADAGRNAVLQFGPDGAAGPSWDEPPTGLLPGYTYVPRCLAADRTRGLVYVLWLRYREEGGDMLLSGVFLDTRAPDGTIVRPLLAVSGTPPVEVFDMALDEEAGDLWLAGPGRLRRLRLPTGVVDKDLVLADDARRVAVNSDGIMAVARPSARHVDVYASSGNLIGQLDLSPNEPLALATGPDGKFHTLVRSERSVDPAAPLVVVVDPYGGPGSERPAAAMGAPLPPAGGWPWAIDVAGDRGVLTTGGRMFEVHRYDAGGTVGAVLLGQPVQEEYAPADRSAAAGLAPLAVAPSADGGLVALDARNSHFVAFDGLGQVAFVASAPDGAMDMDLGPLGAYVTTAGGELLRFSELAPTTDPSAPDASAPCACDLGGRVAAGIGEAYVSRPRTASVGAFDARSLAPQADLHRDGAVGLWPSDLAASADGYLYSADLVQAQVETWSPAGQVLDRWPAGLLSGPRRLAVGTIDGARAVVSIMADGTAEVHAADDGNLMYRFRPAAGDGRPIDATDIAVGASGRLYLAEAGKRTVFVFALGPSATPTPPARPSPSPTPGSLSCTVHGDKVARPASVVVGSTTTVTLTLSAVCPSSARLVGADIVLVLDRSASMQGAKLASAQEAARSFAEMLDVRYHRLGLASFSDDASIDVPLTDSVPAVIDGLYALQAQGGTNMAAALERARDNLLQFGRPEALPVIVLLSDGQNNDQAPDPVPVAQAARAWGAQIYTVGLGSDADGDTLRRIAGRDGAFYPAPTPSELYPVYGEILRVVLSSLAGNLIVEDTLGPGMALAGRVEPPALVSSDSLRWGRSVLPSSGITFTYALAPQAPGCAPTNGRAVADYTDADGARRQLVFPVPTVCAVAPTSTPTPTATPLATATSQPARIHLPVVYRRQCIPRKTHVDVVLLLDVSSSMAGEKLAAAKEAARAFVGLLDFPQDQAAVVGFSEQPSVAASLSGDRNAVLAAIDGLATLAGTRIDRALWAGLLELRGAGRRPGNRPVMVLLSDGGQAGPAADVLDLAYEARAAGATIYCVGLGDDADMGLLQGVAGSTGQAFHAPSATDLEAIYRQIAGVIACR